MTRVVCAGLATRDTIWRVPSHPAPDGRVVATELSTAGGGPAATAAVALARLGIETAFVGAVGDDEAGAFVREGLAGEGIDVSRLAVVGGARTAESTILIGPAGERAIVHFPGTAPPPRIDTAGEWLHLDHVGFAMERDGSARVSLDGGNPIAPLDLSGVALYAPTEERLVQDFGTPQAALDAGAGVVVVTRGMAGSAATDRHGTSFDVPPHPVEAVSTLGAGDVFHGALLAYIARGAALPEALRAANAAAALSCRALDGRSAIPTLAELEDVIS
ncbi:MAG TPA: PfkB family carbohydrate kinase [Gaiellaceae bacterium]|nr:PfkB family carbohydrate kinase [Gaiellaceae bacterium]